MSAQSRTCFVYRSRRQADTYVYLAQSDAFEVLPEDLRRRLGALELAMTLSLHADRPLARARAPVVLEALARQGYYLQLPPPREPLLANERLPA